MALAVTVTKTDYTGNSKVKTGYIAFDSSYPTGGETIAATDFGLAQISSLQLYNAAGYSFHYVPTTAPTATAGTSLDGKIYAQWSGTTGGVLTQVSNATDLSALTTVPFVCRGL